MKLKRKAIDSFFKKIDAVPPDPGQNDLIVPCIDDLDDEAAAWLAAQEEEEEEEDNNEEVEEVPRQPPPKVQRFNSEGVSVLVVERDPGLRCQIDDVCLLASKFYPADFSEQERANLRLQLQHYELAVPTNPKFQNLSSVANLCRQLVETGKANEYSLIDRLIRLVLTLPVSTATSERAFSAMKLVKTRLRNKMGDGFLRDCLIIYIEKEIAIEFTTETLIDDFAELKNRKVRLK